jgi:colanic acid/amylovoran biosynthesis glycosyltransferase
MTEVRIAYLTGRYPATSHSFVAREVAALRERGVEIRTFSIWAADPRDLPSEQDRLEAERTYALLPLRLWPAARAHMRGWRAAPGAYLRTLVRALRLGRPGIRGRFLGASWFVEAIILWDALRRMQIRHVHVHLNGTAPSVALVLTTFGNRLNRDVAWSWSMTVHGSAEFYDVPGERLADKVQSARLVICVSDFTRSQLMAQVTERHWGKLRVIRCGVDPDEFAPRRLDERGGFALVTVARLTQGKGHGVLLEALRQLRDRGLAVRLILVGDGPKRSELEALARELGIESAITFAGAVGREDVHEYYRAANAFCLPSFHEGVPIVLMEAMALELPVVATDVMGVRELVEHEGNGLLIRPGRSDLLADAVERLIVDPDWRRRLGAAGRETVQQRFDIRRSAAEIHTAFEELLGVPSARPQAGTVHESTASS